MVAYRSNSTQVLVAVRGDKRPLRVCVVTRRRFSVGASPTRQSLQPEATGSLCTCCRHYPGAASGRTASLTSPSRISLPRARRSLALRPAHSKPRKGQCAGRPDDPFGAPEPLPTGDRPLSGIRVIDLTRVLAGPTCARTLAEHGADVMKITAAHLPSLGYQELDTGHGKLSAELDLRAPGDVDILRGLVRKADVFSQGYRPGTLANRGLSPEELAAIRPGLVYVSLCAFGHAGPWTSRKRERAAEQRRRERALNEKMQNDDGWNRWADNKIRDALAEHSRDLTETLAELVVELRQEFAEQLAELRTALDVERAAEKADIVTLPRLPLLRRRSDAA
jgi:CoA-transferase family III